MKGDVIVVRYADDFVVGFQYKWEAESFLNDLSSTLYKKNVRVQVQKIPFVVIYTKACSMGKMFHPKSPTSCHRSR